MIKNVRDKKYVNLILLKINLLLHVIFYKVRDRHWYKYFLNATEAQMKLLSFQC